MNRLTSCLLVAIAITGCGGQSTDSSGGGGTTQSQPLCDGSETLRFVLYSGGGYVEQEYGFTNPYGYSLLAITGQCEAYVSQSYMMGVRHLTLTKERAETVAQEVRRASIAAWSSHQDMSCPDAGGNFISDGQSLASCSCGCDPDAPAGLSDALEKAYQWHDTLWAEGSPLTGPVAVAAAPDSSPAPGVTAVPWSLSWPITDLPTPNTSAGKVVTDTADLATLRQLRADAALSSLSYVPVVDGEQYRLYVRDELPTELATKLDVLLGK
ncbi:MAG: hypothetical protein KC776_09950 [Myxococcales bacterium]|nr:hypothetical protein [Myxococcales bacterium]MCB9581317.1 hypothetical protein [Polyangiaceae bacterium]